MIKWMECLDKMNGMSWWNDWNVFFKRKECLDRMIEMSWWNQWNVLMKWIECLESTSSLLSSKLSGGQNCGMVWGITLTAFDDTGRRDSRSAPRHICCRWSPEEASVLQWWIKAWYHAVRSDSSSSPCQIPDPVLNIVMYLDE